jgi:hypothetical protein
MITVQRQRSKKGEDPECSEPLPNDGCLYYACLLDGRRDVTSKTMIGYCKDPLNMVLDYPWNIHLIMGPLERYECTTLCNEWVKQTRGFQSKLHKAELLSHKYNAPMMFM